MRSQYVGDAMSMQENCQLRPPHTQTEWLAYYHTRYLTLRAPLGFPPGLYVDATDAHSLHLMVWDADKAVAAAVVRGECLADARAQIRYMGVLDAYQRKGMGTLLLQAIEAQLTEQGVRVFGLNARDYAVPFYLAAGYHIVRDAGILIADIPHFWMEKAAENAR